ncbi:LytTR family DNA-binding domain-containing protein [Chitinophaga agri]|uniref:LytTR family transcriptional regulator n=1 Tax=Chitinophaga agri TaxID=2703787 RepID=A0A6B9ZKN0_9BACT|nr:LytTR family DNA-binding domain-containing protein [Chitinophaga agri]QHS62980.1 LytTR family transcriptional regulator [Chitinophaga agri]
MPGYTVEKPILLPLKDGTYKPVRINNILYAEVDKAYIIVHYVDGKSEPFPISLTKLEETLPADYFSRTSRNYIAAIYNVDNVGKDAIKIGAVTLPLTDKYRRQFFSRFYSFIGKD